MDIFPDVSPLLGVVLLRLRANLRKSISKILYSKFVGEALIGFRISKFSTQKSKINRAQYWAREFRGRFVSRSEGVVTYAEIEPNGECDRNYPHKTSPENKNSNPGEQK